MAMRWPLVTIVVAALAAFGGAGFSGVLAPGTEEGDQDESGGGVDRAEEDDQDEAAGTPTEGTGNDSTPTETPTASPTGSVTTTPTPTVTTTPTPNLTASPTPTHTATPFD
jgi:hypothetical protein